jgi:hypothetical protein
MGWTLETPHMTQSATIRERELEASDAPKLKG